MAAVVLVQGCEKHCNIVNVCRKEGLYVNVAKKKIEQNRKNERTVKDILFLRHHKIPSSDLR